MSRKVASLSQLDAFIAKVEQRIAEQVTRLERARYGVLSSRPAACRLADLKVDLLSYQGARDAIVASRHRADRPGLS